MSGPTLQAKESFNFLVIQKKDFREFELLGSSSFNDPWAGITQRIPHLMTMASFLRTFSFFLLVSPALHASCKEQLCITYCLPLGTLL